MTTLYYLTQWSDEVIPCAPTLEAWAEWLAKPDEEWNRNAAAPTGEEYRASALKILGDVRVEWIDGQWQAVGSVPEGTSVFYLRWQEGGQGWDVEHSANTIADAADGVDSDDGPLFFACAQDLPDLQIRFLNDEQGARCEIIGEVQ